MKAAEVFSVANNNFSLVNANSTIIKEYSMLMLSYGDIEILEHFSQLRKNAKGSGLSLEIMFFDSRFIYDFVISSNTVVTTLVKVNTVTLIDTHTYYSSDPNENSELTIKDSVTLNIRQSSVLLLYYTVDFKKIEDIYRIKNALSKII